MKVDITEYSLKRKALAPTAMSFLTFYNMANWSFLSFNDSYSSSSCDEAYTLMLVIDIALKKAHNKARAEEE